LGAVPFSVSATASSGLPVTFASMTTAVCTVNVGTVTMIAAGTCTIRAAQAGNANYAAASNVDRSFNVTQGAQAISFAAAVNYATGNNPHGIAVADLNGDGRADLLVVNSISYTVSIFIGNGDGTFAAGTTLSSGGRPTDIVVGDFNGDGRADLAIANDLGNSVTIYLGNGNGTFGTASTVGVGLAPSSVAVGDFNSDGRLDLVVTNGSSGSTVGQTVTVLLGNGNGTFQSPRSYATGTNPRAVVVGDLNSDGKLDLVVANSGASSVSVLLGIGDGTFRPHVTYDPGFSPWALSIVDLNRDGKPDLVVTGNGVSLNGIQKGLSVLLGRGDGTFVGATTMASGNGPQGIATADFDGDGNIDIVVADAFDNVVSILPGNGDGTFRATRTLATGLYPYSIAVGDFNADGRPDLVVSNYFSKSISVLLNGVTLNSAATVIAQTGTPQSALLNAPFATPLSVVVRDTANAAIPGAIVSFTAPTYGISGAFPGPTYNVQVTTDAAGVATAPAFTANGTVGAFSVFARYSAASAIFALTNATANHAPLFTSAAPPNGTINVPYNFTVAASGTPTPTFSVLPNSLPTGLALNSASGLIVGTPSALGTFAGMLSATNGVPPDATQSFAITIVTASQSITFALTGDKPLAAAPFMVSATASSGLAVGFASLTAPICTLAGNVVTLVAVGTCTIRASQSGNANFIAAPNVDQSFTVTASQASQTIIFAGLPNVAFGTSPFVVNAAATSGLPVNFSSLTSSVCNSSGNSLALVAVGTCTIRASQAGNANFIAAPNVDQSFSVNRGNQTISFGALADQGFGAAPFTISASASSGLVVNFSSLTTAVCTVSGNAVTLVAPGPCTIRAAQGGSANYTAAPNVDRSFSVTGSGGHSLFAAPVNYPTRLNPSDIVVADLNLDGKLDLVVKNSIDISILLGNGDGTFTPGVTLPMITQPARIAVGDFTGHGVPDIAVTSLSSNNVMIYPGNGDGTFGTAKAIAVGSGQFAIAAVDLNGDGRPDLAMTTNPSGPFASYLSVLLGKGDATFQALLTDAGSTAYTLAPGDFNGDGKIDFSFTHTDTNSVSILAGRGDGTFTRGGNFAAGPYPDDLVVADFNGDGNLDLAVVNFDGNNVSVLLGRGDGTFAPAVNYRVGISPFRITVGDFDGDGNIDLAVTNNVDNNIAVLLGNGDGTFKPALTFAVGAGPGAVARGDFNGDGKPDLVVAYSLGSSVSVLLNTAVADPPASIAGKAGATQSAAVGASFATPLAAIVRDAANHPLVGALVTFAAPGSGASGAFPGGRRSVQVISDNTGVAVAPIFIANATAGAFAVVATVAGLSVPFALTNTTTSQAPVFTSAPLPNGIYNTAYTFRITASGSPAPTFQVPANALPAGLILNGVTGVISGIPTVVGTFTGTFTSANGVVPAATQAFSLTIAPSSQTITVVALGNQAFTTPPFLLTASASSGLLVTFSSLTPSVCATTSNTVALIAAGTCTVRATQDGNALYAPAQIVDRSFSVTAGNQAITFQPIVVAPTTSLPAAGGPDQLVAAASSRLPVNFASLTPTICRIDADMLTLLHVGTCTVRAAQGGNANFSAAANVDQSVAVSPAYQQLTFWQPPTQSTLHAQVILNAAASSGLPLSFSTLTPTVCTVSGGVVTLVSPGTCTVVATQAGSPDFSAISGSRSFNVVAGQVLVSPPIPGPFIEGPFVEFSTLLGGSGGHDLALDVAVAPDGSANVVGSVAGTDFPGLGSTAFTNGGLDLLYTAKLNPSRGQLYIVTVVGARSPDMTGSGTKPIASLEGMAVDASGNVYVAAYANGRTFPVTGGTYARTGSKFIYRVSGGGNVQALGYAIDPAVSTIRALTVDSAGSVYFSGIAGPGMVTTTNALISTPQAPAGGPYLIKLAPDGNATAFATYLSVQGSRPSVPSVPHPSPCVNDGFPPDRQSTFDAATTAYAMVVDAAGNTYLAGQAAANDFPVTLNAPDTADDENRDAFVAKVNPTGTAMVWVARLGGYDAERATGIALAADGSVVVGGKTATCNFTGSGAFQIGVDFPQGQLLVDREFGFVAKLAADGSRWNFVAAIGAGGGNLVRGRESADPSPVKVAVNQTGAIYAAGSTVYSTSLPLGGAVFDPSCSCVVSGQPSLAFSAGGGAFLMKVAPDGRSLSYSVVLGSGVATGLTLDNFGAAYVAGYGGSAFVAKVVSQNAPVVLSSTSTPGVAGQSVILEAKVGDARWPGSIEFRDGAQLLATVPVAGSTATFNTTFPVGIHRLNAVFRGSGPFANAAAPEVVQVINQAPAGP
jgi:FG-GAP-like repeat/Bacterial Ig-like domain (group 3)/Putative Ig domain